MDVEQPSHHIQRNNSPKNSWDDLKFGKNLIGEDDPNDSKYSSFKINRPLKTTLLLTNQDADSCPEIDVSDL